MTKRAGISGVIILIAVILILIAGMAALTVYSGGLDNIGGVMNEFVSTGGDKLSKGEQAADEKLDDVLAGGDVTSTSGTGSPGSGDFGGSGEVSRSSYTIRQGTAEETTVYVIDSNTDGPTIFLTGGFHGNEPSGFKAASDIKDWKIDAGKLVVIPRASEKAISQNTRGADYVGTGESDLNRHFPSGEQPLSLLAQDIWNEVKSHNPDFVLDLHASKGIYPDGVGQGVFSTQAGDASSKSSTVIQYLNNNYVSNDKYKFTGATSSDGSRDMLKHKVGADMNTPAVIMETYDKSANEVPLDKQVTWQKAGTDRFLELYGMIDG